MQLFSLKKTLIFIYFNIIIFHCNSRKIWKIYIQKKKINILLSPSSPQSLLLIVKQIDQRQILHHFYALFVNCCKKKRRTISCHTCACVFSYDLFVCPSVCHLIGINWLNLEMMIEFDDYNLTTHRVIF